MQQELSALYRAFFDSAKIPDALASRLSCPLLLAVGSWPAAARRVLFVGQETLGWAWNAGWYYPWRHPRLATLADFKAYNDAVEALVEGYSAFAFSRHQPRNLNGAFWRAFHLLNGVINADGTAAMLWTNIFRCDVAGGSVLRGCSPPELRDLMAFQRGLLTSEIRVLNPTAVLFFTGPDYDFELLSEFRNAALVPVPGRTERQFARIRHPDLPSMVIRTYHPSYLRREPERWAWLEEIAAELT
jgi:hypothetical protein